VLMKIGGAVAAVFALFAFWPLLQLKKQPRAKKAEDIAIDEEAAIRHLCRAISCETTGYVDEHTGRFREFIKLQAQLEEDYPVVFDTVTVYNVEPFSRLYRWKGKDTGRKPILLLAHQDVVPISEGTEKDWRYPPFAGTEAEGFVWGRGAIDMKNALCGIFEALEYLIRQGFVPDRDVYLCTTCDEEIMGAGSGRVAGLCRELGLHFEFALDEGASFMRGDMFGAKDAVFACVCTYEKGYCDVRLQIKDEGGHSAYPKADTALSKMAKALARIEQNRFPMDVNDTFIQFYRAIAPYCDFRTKWMAAHPKLCAKALAQRIADSGPHGNAMVRTTTALTQIGASEAPNALPQNVWANINFRLNAGYTYDGLYEFVQRIAGPEFAVSMPVKSNPSRPARTDTPAYFAISETIRETFGEDIPVVPTAFFAGTDSRMFDGVSDDVYKFMPAMSHMRYASGMHGTNERIGISDYINGIRFYIRLLNKTCGGTKKE